MNWYLMRIGNGYISRHLRYINWFKNNTNISSKQEKLNLFNFKFSSDENMKNFKDYLTKKDKPDVSLKNLAIVLLLWSFFSHYRLLK